MSDEQRFALGARGDPTPEPGLVRDEIGRVFVVLPDGSRQPLSGGGSQPGMLLVKDFLFTEQTTAGTYTATLPVPAKTTIAEVAAYLLGVSDPGVTGWVADTALLEVGDTENVDGYAAAFDLVVNATPYDPLTTPADAVSGGGMWGMNSLDGVYASAVKLNALGEGPHSSGLYYENADTITATVVTTIGSPPVVPAGIMLLRIYYFTAVTPTAAAFT